MSDEKLRPAIEAQQVTWRALQASVGKTIADVEYGFEKTHPHSHQSEKLILHFTDSTSLHVSIGSNAMNLTKYPVQGIQAV